MTTQTLLITSATARIASLVTVFTAVGTGVMAGVFFAFSTTVMKALNRQPAPHAIATMQAINLTIINPLFLLVLMGTTICCVGLIVTAPFSGLPHAGLRVAGAAIFLVGAIGVTAAVNVPMNNALAIVDPNGANALTVWKDFTGRWTTFNHIRTLASVVATALLALATWPPHR